jgi:uncharacterized membrane protein
MLFLSAVNTKLARSLPTFSYIDPNYKEYYYGFMNLFTIWSIRNWVGKMVNFHHLGFTLLTGQVTEVLTPDI